VYCTKTTVICSGINNLHICMYSFISRQSSAIDGKETYASKYCHSGWCINIYLGGVVLCCENYVSKTS
jgi:hypothetical protein